MRQVPAIPPLLAATVRGDFAHIQLQGSQPSQKYQNCGGRGGCCSATVVQFSDAAFSRLAGRRGRGGTRRLRFRLGLAVLHGLAFVWAIGCPVAILTAIEAISAVEVSVVSGGSVPGILP